MNIRKRLATTPRQEADATDRTSRGVAGWLVAGSVTIGLLVGCAEGTSRDAERGKAQDAERTSVVSNMQATHSARVLQQGTPPTETSEP